MIRQSIVNFHFFKMLVFSFRLLLSLSDPLFNSLSEGVTGATSFVMVGLTWIVGVMTLELVVEDVVVVSVVVVEVAAVVEGEFPCAGDKTSFNLSVLGWSKRNWDKWTESRSWSLPSDVCCKKCPHSWKWSIHETVKMREWERS